MSLVVLALVDSTSFGTLLIPLWLMLAPGRLRPGRIVLFLGTVAGFYLLLGLVLLAGSSILLDVIDAALDSTAARGGQLVVGVALMVLGLTMEPLTKAGKEKRAARRAEKELTVGPGRLTRWRERAMDGSAPGASVVTLALAAAAVEAASMLPYLVAIGLLGTSDLSLAAGGVVLIGYCLVMIIPALLLLGIRVLLHTRVAPSLSRLEAWITRNAREATAWVVFLIGLFVLRDAIGALGWGR